MKTLFSVLIVMGLFITVSCNNSSDKTSKETDTSAMMNNAMPKMDMQPDSSMTMITPTFTSVDAKLSVDIKTIVDHYLHIKNALVNNDGNNAAIGGKEMEEAISKVDKSLFTADQKKVYDGIADDLKEHAEHIGANEDKIEHQREHFSMMSEDVYDLVKAFGGGQTLYHDHCPMANDSKGGMWLSEVKEVKNPYFGGKMNDCVKVMEVIK
ncbi:MAG: DUF3347 domain-containing protein [Chitinophagaceae bacterium]